MNLRLHNDQYFYRDTISWKVTNLTLRHGYPLPDANPVFQYHGRIIIIIVVVVIFIIIIIIIIVIIIIIIIIRQKLGSMGFVQQNIKLSLL